MATPRKRGRAGQRDRQRRLRRSGGLCQMCLDLGRTTVATRVDHKIPLAHDGPDEDWNTRNLCEAHHLEVTAEQFGHQTPKHCGVGRDGRPTAPGHAWNQPRSAQPARS
jgi:5-methylcytosine-specific restriction protein A